MSLLIFSNILFVIVTADYINVPIFHYNNSRMDLLKQPFWYYERIIIYIKIRTKKIKLLLFSKNVLKKKHTQTQLIEIHRMDVIIFSYTKNSCIPFLKVQKL